MGAGRADGDRPRPGSAPVWGGAGERGRRSGRERSGVQAGRAAAAGGGGGARGAPTGAAARPAVPPRPRGSRGQVLAGPSAPGAGPRFRFGADPALRRERTPTLGRRSASKEDGAQPREAPRNGIDLDINPGRLPPPPLPASRAAGPRSPLPVRRRGAGPGERDGAAGLAEPGAAASPGAARSRRARGLDANRSPSGGASAAGTALPAPAAGAPTPALRKQPGHLCPAGPGLRPGARGERVPQ